MSLYSLEEICEDCIFAVYEENPNGKKILWNCEKGIEEEVNFIRGSCDSKITFNENEI